MSKKFSVLLSLVISLLSIMVIAVWTTTGESNVPIPISTIKIIDFDELNEDGDKIKNLKDIVNDNNLKYVFKYEANPQSADDALLKVFVNTDRVEAMIDVIESEVHIFFSNLTNLNFVIVTIKDEKTNVSDEIILLFKMSGEVIVPDLD